MKGALALVIVATVIGSVYVLTEKQSIVNQHPWTTNESTINRSSVTESSASESSILCPITGSTSVVVYGETSYGEVGYWSLSWIVHFLDWWQSQDQNVRYVVLDSADVRAHCHLGDYPNVKIYIQPGGDAYKQQISLGSEGKNNILDYLDSHNGSYVGICAGFYYAATDYYWQGILYNHPNLLGRTPTLEGPITDIAYWPHYAMTHLSNGLEAIYYGGPTRGWRQTPAGMPGEVRSTFASLPNNLPAVVVYQRMLLTSVHLEAYEDEGVTGLSTAQRVKNYEYLAHLINEVAGTGYSLATYANVPESSVSLDAYASGCIGHLDGSGCWCVLDTCAVMAKCIQILARTEQ